MSNKKKNNSKQEYEKNSQLQKANQQIEELQKEKDNLKKLLLQYQSNDNKNQSQNESSHNFTNNSVYDKQIDHQRQQSQNKIQSYNDQVEQNEQGKYSFQTNSNLHDRNNSYKQYGEQNRKQNNEEDLNKVTLKTENIKDEVLKLGQTMQEIFKKIEGYEKVNDKKKENYRSKQRDYRESHHQERLSHRTRDKQHNSRKRYLNKKSPKKSYQSTDSDEYNQAAGEFSSSSSCFNSGSNSSQISQDNNSDSRNSSIDSKYYYYSNSKQSQKGNRKKQRNQRDEKSKSHHSKQRSHQSSNIDNELEEEALQLLNTIQLNPSTKLAFIQKFGNEDIFLETLKQSKKNKIVLLQIIRMMLEIINSNGNSGSDFSQQLYAQNYSSYLNQSNTHKKSYSNSNVIVSPINLPKVTSSRTQYANSPNIYNQMNSAGNTHSASQQYTGENLIKLLEQRVQNVSNTQPSNFLKSSSLQQNSLNNPMLIQSNLKLNNSQQGQLTTDQLASSQLLSTAQSRFGLLNYYPEKPKIQFQVELRDIQNREAILKMQEYEGQIESLESKLKNLRQKVEEDSQRRAQEEADRIRRQQEDYLRRKAEREQEEQLRKQKIEQEEFERLRREKEEYERRIKHYKDEEEKLKQKIKEEEQRLRNKEEEERRLQKEKEEEEQRRRLREKQEEDERRLQREIEEQQQKLLLKLQPQVQEDQLLTNERVQTSGSESNKKIPDYMKVTKNRCNYVKDVQKDYLRRSYSIGSNGSTPKSGRDSVNIVANQNWEKVLNKFTENAAENNSQNSDVSPVDSDYKRKSNFATLKASIHKQSGETPKSQKSSNPAQSSAPRNFQSNFADLVNQEVQKHKQFTQPFQADTNQPRNQTPKSNKSQSFQQRQQDTFLQTRDVSPKQQPIQFNNDQKQINQAKAISPKQYEQQLNNNQTTSEKSIKSDNNNNNQPSERMISEIQMKVVDKSQTQLQQSVDEDQKLINLLTGNKEEEKTGGENINQIQNGQTFSKIEAVEDNLHDELEQLNNLLEMKKQQKKKTIIQQANIQIEAIQEEKENSLQTGRAADQKNQNQGVIQNESIAFSNIKENDSNLISPQTKQVNSPPIFTQQIEQQKPNLNLSFNQANQLNSQEDVTSKKNYDQKDKSISQIAHNQSEDFSQLGIENELLYQNQIQDPDENLSNLNDLSSPNQQSTIPKDSPQVSTQKPTQLLKNVVKTKIISQLKSAGTSKQSNPPSLSQSQQIKRSDNKKLSSLQNTASKAPVSVATSQPKVTSYLQKKQLVSTNQKVAEKSKTEPSNQSALQSKSNTKLQSQQSLNIGSQSNLNKSQLANKSTLSINQNNNSIIEQKQNSYSQLKASSATQKPNSTTAVTRTSTKSSTIVPKAANSNSTLNSSTLNKSKAEDGKKTIAESTVTKSSTTKTTSITSTKSSSYAQKAASKQKAN
ncbi:hypothetical protein ABPG74_000145 [Tetrahymena malaccensis]